MTDGRAIPRWRKPVVWLVVAVLGAGGAGWLVRGNLLHPRGDPVADVGSPAAPSGGGGGANATTAPVVAAALEVDDTVKPSAALDAQMAKDPDRAPTHKSINCTTGECHAKEAKHKVLHVPFAQGACESCHVSTSV